MSQSLYFTHQENRYVALTLQYSFGIFCFLGKVLVLLVERIKL